jgi:hypothetical protein
MKKGKTFFYILQDNLITFLSDKCDELDERSACETVIFAGLLHTASCPVHTENIHLYRKDRQWRAVKHNGHKINRGKETAEHIDSVTIHIAILF